MMGAAGEQQITNQQNMDLPENNALVICDDFQVSSPISIGPISANNGAKVNMNQQNGKSRSANQKISQSLKTSLSNQYLNQKPMGSKGGNSRAGGPTLNSNLSILLEEDSLQQQLSVCNQTTNPVFSTLSNNNNNPNDTLLMMMMNGIDHQSNNPHTQKTTIQSNQSTYDGRSTSGKGESRKSDGGGGKSADRSSTSQIRVTNIANNPQQIGKQVGTSKNGGKHVVNYSS